MTTAKDRLKQKLTGSPVPASQAYLDAGFTLRGSYGDGEIYENPNDNTLVYISPGLQAQIKTLPDKSCKEKHHKKSCNQDSSKN